MSSIQTGIKVYNSIEEALTAPEQKIRIDLQGKRLKTLPKGFEALEKIPYLELDLSYNSGLQIDYVLPQLATLNNLRGLALMRIEFGNLPSSIGDLQHLESLTLWGNKSTSIPVDFAKLQSLKYLILRTNLFKEIPVQINTLRQLEYLEMSYCPIKDLSPEFCKNMGNSLQKLILKNCSFKRLPDEIKELKALITLNLRENNLHSFPESIKQMTHLKELVYDGNVRLKNEHLLDIHKDLLNLKTLNLYNFQLTKLPNFVSQMTNLESLNLEQNQLETLPEYLGDLPNLKELKLSNNPTFDVAALWKSLEEGKFPKLNKKNLPSIDLKKKGENFFSPNIEDLTINPRDYATFPMEIFGLKKLKRLYISFYDGENKEANINELPDRFDQLEALEDLSINAINGLRNLPPSVYNSQTIKQIYCYGQADLRMDFVGLSNMKNLESLNCNVFEDQVESLPLLTNISHLGITNATVKALPEGMKNLKKLSTFGFDGLTDLDVEDTISKLPYLETYSSYYRRTLPKNLHELESLKRVEVYQVPFADVLDFVEKSESIEELTYQFAERSFPANIAILNKLKKCNLTNSYNSNDKSPIVIPLELALLDFQRVDLSRIYGGIELEKKSVVKINGFQLENDFQKKIAFALLLGRFDEIGELLENPFVSNPSLNGVNIFLFGTPTFSTSKELQENLKKRGASISKKLDENVTHILLSSKIKDDIEEIMKANKPFILEDYFKAQVFSEDMPYLMEEGSDEMTKQITRLLKSTDEEDDNITLILELIEGGGANKIILSYLYVIHLFHDDNEIRKKSRKLFRKYASIELQSFLKNNWKDSLRNSQPHHLFHHEDLDYFACILASKMVRFHKLSKTSSDKSWLLYDLGNLGIRNSLTEFSPTLMDLDFLNSITFTGDGQTFDLEKSFPFFCDNNIKQIRFGNVAFNQFPKEFFSFGNLELLSLSGIWGAEKSNQLAIPLLPKMDNLKQLDIYNINFTQIENFKNVVGKVENLRLQNTNLQLHLNLFEDSKYLKTFTCDDNNELSNLNLNFENFEEIEEVYLANIPITKLEDNFYKCSKLNRFNVTSTNITELPYSVMCIGSKSDSNISLRLCDNKIESLGNKKISLGNIFNNLLHKKRRFNINLENNQMSEIPKIFSEILISELNLNKNPIVSIPENIGSFDIEGIIHLDQTNITKIPLSIFQLKARVGVANRTEELILPDIDSIPNFYGQKQFGGKSADIYRKINELIETKRITN